MTPRTKEMVKPLVSFDRKLASTASFLCTRSFLTALMFRLPLLTHLQTCRTQTGSWLSERMPMRWEAGKTVC